MSSAALPVLGELMTSKCFWCASFLVTMLTISRLTAQTKSEPEVLNNDTIVTMAKAHIGAEVIIEQIRTTPGDYSLKASELIKLKQQGVPDSVILAMQTQAAKSGATSRPGKPQQQAVPNASNGQHQTPPSRWQIEETEDRMSGTKGFNAFMWQHTKDGQQDGEINITATCDPRLLNLKFVFLSDEKPGVVFKAASAPSLLRSQNIEIISRMRINDDPVKTVNSREEFANYVDITFGWNKFPKAFNARDGQLYTGTQSLFSEGNPPVAFGARSITVELTTENDVKHVINLNPQDPVFQKFGSRCDNEFWGGAGAGLSATATPSTPPSARGNPTAPVTPLMLRNASAGPAEKRAARTYQGNLDGFIAALPGYLQRAAAGIGAPARTYDYETAYIDHAARQCASITAEQAASVTFHNIIDVSKLGEAFRDCAAPYGLPVPKQAGPPDRSHPAELAVLVRPLRLWGDGNGISITVSFTEVGFPGRRFGNRQTCAQGLDCGIAIGLIESRKAVGTNPR
jgi:hypothetical protein